MVYSSWRARSIFPTRWSPGPEAASACAKGGAPAGLLRAQKGDLTITSRSKEGSGMGSQATARSGYASMFGSSIEGVARLWPLRGIHFFRTGLRTRSGPRRQCNSEGSNLLLDRIAHPEF